MNIELLWNAAEWEAPEIERVWWELCRRHGGLEVLFSSPTYFSHMGFMKPEAKRMVALVRDASGTIVALAPLWREPTTLDFVVGARYLGQYRLPSWRVLGGEPLAPRDATILEPLFVALIDAFGHDVSILLPMVERDGAVHQLLADWARRQGRYFVYSPTVPGSGLTHSLTLASFDQYLQRQFKSKHRSTLKRQLKQLGSEIGPLQLVTYRTPAEVTPFLDASRPVAEASWQRVASGLEFEDTAFWTKKLHDLADRGAFHSFVLFAGTRPVAFILGYRLEGVFYYVKTAYIRSLAKLAPGTCILYLALEALGGEAAAAKQPIRVNFMFGDAPYKARFGDAQQRSDDLIILPRSSSNLVRWGSHAAFRAAVVFMRDRVRRLQPLKRPVEIG